MKQVEANPLSRQKPKRVIICERCGQEKMHKAKNMCAVCYSKAKYEKKLESKNFIF